MAVDNDDVDIDDNDVLSLVDDGDDLIENIGDDNPELDGDDDSDDKRKSKQFDDDEVEEYGKKVQRRINKEVQKRKVLEDRLASQEAEHERRMSEFEERFNAREQEEEDASITEKLEDVESRRRENHEVGDYDQSLEDEWFDLKSKQRDAKKRKPNRKPQPKARDDSDNTDVNTDTEKRESAPVPDEQKKWLESNNWYGKNKARSDYANKEYLQLVSDGYDPEDTDIYDELDKRLSGGTSDDNVDNDNVAIDDERDERPPPPAAPNRGNSNKNRKKNTFTNSDKQKMRDWNLDPNDPAQRKAWLAEKRSA